MDILNKLFTSDYGEARVRIMRFFLSNSKSVFELKEIVSKLKLKPEIAKKEINSLLSISFLEKESLRPSKNLVYKMNLNFEYFDSVYNLLFDFVHMDKKNIFERFKKIGRLKLFLFAGVFVGDNESLADVLIVSDNLKTKELEKVLAEMNINFGRVLKYLIMDIDEYNYRRQMCDRTLNIVLDGQRIDWLNKIQVASYK